MADLHPNAGVEFDSAAGWQFNASSSSADAYSSWLQPSASQHNLSASADNETTMLLASRSSQLSSYLQQVSVRPTRARVDVLTATISECCKLAVSAGKLGRLARAMKQVEHGLALAAGREEEHPAVSVEVARLQLNHSWLLSVSGRHLEALTSIAEAHKLLRRVIAWSDTCGMDDISALALGAEASSLQSAAALAEAVELEPLAVAGSSVLAAHSADADGAKADSGSDPAGEFLQRYSDALGFATSRLPTHHPAVLTAQRIHKESSKHLAAVRSESRPQTVQPDGTGTEQALSSTEDETRPHSSPPQQGNSHSELRSWGKAAAKKRAPFARRGALVKQMKPDGDGVTAPSKGMVKRVRRSQTATGLFFKQQTTPKDIFTAYLHDAAFENDMRWERKMGGESRHEDMRKQLMHQRRIVRLAGTTGREELGDVKYSAVGHRMQMKGLLKDNMTRSMPNLMFEAKVSGKCPEALHLHTLGQDLRPAKAAEQQPEKRRISLAGLALRSPLQKD
mmetsp:Transcript_63389/g.151291  ORF Transcript_63389/g.151291 Transcript_63389/m.151291 type:complete len:509 (-) Transcript_63389:18-1544(-)